MRTSLSCLALLAVAVGGAPGKRLLLEDNYYAIMQRLGALETEVADLKRQNGRRLEDIHIFFQNL